MIKKKPTERITEKTITEVLKRSKAKCEDCGIPTEQPLHHVNFKSQYFGKDRNLPWNLAELCEYHHRILHHAGTDTEVKEKKRLDYKLKALALGRYHGKNKTELSLMVRRAYLKTQ